MSLVMRIGGQHVMVFPPDRGGIVITLIGRMGNRPGIRPLTANPCQAPGPRTAPRSSRQTATRPSTLPQVGPSDLLPCCPRALLHRERGPLP